ncbi:MAG: glycosyltransferase family 2 protein [Chloroflexi bacterium]|nr:glycosyltransferase family 2 protein [Chloroflexota bacterium]
MGKKKRARGRKSPRPEVPSSKSAGLTSIIIAVHNHVDATRLCIESIKRCTENTPYELIVVDNGSTDETPSYLKTTGARVIRFAENKGIATAWNAGMRAARGRYLAVLHNDVLVTPGWLETLLKAFDDHRVAAACPLYTEMNLLSNFNALAARAANLPTKIFDNELISCCFILRRACVSRVGFFDERLSFGPYAELDYDCRLAKTMARVVWVNSAIVHHFVARTALDVPGFYDDNDQRDWKYVLGKWSRPHVEAKPVETPERLSAARRVTLPDSIPDYPEHRAPAAPAAGAKPPRVIACVCFYNERDMLPGCLESLDGVDEIVLVDGAYADFPHSTPGSTDGTLEWIKERQKGDSRIRLIETTRPWADEIEKRTACFVGQDGDWYLNIDADERLVWDGENPFEELRAFLSACPFSSLSLEVNNQGVSLQYMRLFPHRPGIRYETTHFNLVADGKMLFAEYLALGTAHWYPALKFVHLKHERASSRKDEKLAYSHKLRISELEAIKKEIIHCWNDPSKAIEHRAFVEMYALKLCVLDKQEAETLALDPKYL